MDFGLVSFIIRVKNIKKKFLQKSLRSALSQTYKNIEIIVVFDKGDPELDKQIWETISEFKNDPRLKLFYREKGRGHIEAMNFGLSKAEGKFIAVLDSDDYSSENRVSRQLHYLKENELNFVGSWARFYSEEDELVAELKIPITHKNIRDKILVHNPFSHSSVLYEKSILKQTGYYDTKFPGCEEYDFYLRVLANGFKVGNIPEFLVSIIQRKDSLMAKTKWNTRKGYVKSKFRAILYYHYHRISDLFYTLISPIVFLVPVSKDKLILSKFGWYKTMNKREK